MPLYRIMHTLQDVDELSADRYVNTYFVHAPATLDDTALTTVTTALRDFYQQAHTPSTIPIVNYLGKNVHGAGSKVKIYDMADPKPRPVRHEQVFTLAGTPASGQLIPNEVACCLTFKATPAPGVKPQSTRGRVYLGPFNVTALSSEGDNVDSRPKDTLRNSILDSAVALKAAWTAAGVTWCIASRVQQQYYEVVNVSVDDAFDTQRRRGVKPTVRTVRPVAVAGGGGGTSGSW